MAIVPIETLKTKFESGDFPRSTDYQDLIDTLSSASGAITSTNDLSEGATNKYFTDERAQDALGNSLGTGLSYNDTTGAISVTSNTYDSYGSASTVAGNLATHESDTTTHGTTGNIVGTSDTQTLTNKTLTSPKINEDVVMSATATELNILDGATLSTIELNYVDGVTSAIQTQLNNKAPLADPTFTGTVSGVTKTHVGLGNVDNTTDAGKPVSTATQTALDLKANLAAPTFTGTVVLPSTTSIGDVSSTELSYLNNVTSAIQTQLDAKAPTVSPTFTGTVAGITKSMVDLANVDNTTDLNKPISTATQTALDLKSPIASPTFTGSVTLPGSPTQDLHAATKAYVDNISAGLNFHQPVRVATTANITLSGTQTIDGVSLSVGDRVLVKDQTTQTENGIYVVASSSWSRATDADNTPDGELKGGDFTLVLEGTVGSGYGYVCSNTSAITIGTTNVTYAAFNAAKAVIAGSGLTESTPGTLDIATGGVTSTMISDGTILNADINASAAIDWTKLAISSTVSSTEIGYVDGVTSAIQTQIDSKAPSASPTFTGTVSGVTKTHVGLGSVDNTADTAKPVSTAQQTALDLKAPLASPTFSGTPTLPTGTIATTQTAGNSTTAVATTAFVTTADNLKANLAGPTFTGTVTIPTLDVTTKLIAEQSFTVALSDETTSITTGASKVTFRAPFAMTLTKIPRASLANAGTGTSTVVDINKSGTSILSTKLTIDATQKTSTTSATTAVLSSSTITDDEEITIDIDAAGTAARGLKVTIFYKRS